MIQGSWQKFHNFYPIIIMKLSHSICFYDIWGEFWSVENMGARVCTCFLCMAKLKPCEYFRSVIFSPILLELDMKVASYDILAKFKNGFSHLKKMCAECDGVFAIWLWWNLVKTQKSHFVPIFCPSAKSIIKLAQIICSFYTGAALEIGFCPLKGMAARR